MKKYKIFIKKYKNPQLKTRSDVWNKTRILNVAMKKKAIVITLNFFMVNQEHRRERRDDQNQNGINLQPRNCTRGKANKNQDNNKIGYNVDLPKIELPIFLGETSRG